MSPVNNDLGGAKGLQSPTTGLSPTGRTKDAGGGTEFAARLDSKPGGSAGLMTLTGASVVSSATGLQIGMGGSQGTMGAGASALPGGASVSLGAGPGGIGAGASVGGGGGDPLANVATQGGGSQAQLFQATKDMQEMQMSFNLQYLNLQNQMQNENRQFTMVSNIMKTKHDTVKNSISNIR